MATRSFIVALALGAAIGPPPAFSQQTYVEDGMWNDPEFLETLRAGAEELRLPEAGTATLSLKLLP